MMLIKKYMSYIILALSLFPTTSGAILFIAHDLGPIDDDLLIHFNAIQNMQGDLIGDIEYIPGHTNNNFIYEEIGDFLNILFDLDDIEYLVFSVIDGNFQLIENDLELAQLDGVEWLVVQVLPNLADAPLHMLPIDDVSLAVTVRQSLDSEDPDNP